MFDLTSEQEYLVTKYVRGVLMQYTDGKPLPRPSYELKEILTDHTGQLFVGLEYRDKKYGCRGRCGEKFLNNLTGAAKDIIDEKDHERFDPNGQPLTSKEISRAKISVSILHSHKTLDFNSLSNKNILDQLNPAINGLTIWVQYNNKQYAATYIPSVFQHYANNTSNIRARCGELLKSLKRKAIGKNWNDQIRKTRTVKAQLYQSYDIVSYPRLMSEQYWENGKKILIMPGEDRCKCPPCRFFWKADTPLNENENSANYANTPRNLC